MGHLRPTLDAARFQSPSSWCPLWRDTSLTMSGLRRTTSSSRLPRVILYGEPSSDRWIVACDAAGVTGLHFHDLRGSGATWAAHGGATVAELMARLGHTTPNMAMRYQHATQERDAALAAKLGASLQRCQVRIGASGYRSAHRIVRYCTLIAREPFRDHEK